MESYFHIEFYREMNVLIQTVKQEISSMFKHFVYFIKRTFYEEEKTL